MQVDMGKCKNCKWWEELQMMFPRGNHGQCRKYAPRKIVAGCGVGESPEYDKDWAVVGGNDWCGEFEDKE